jgi:hypothetical protein
MPRSTAVLPVHYSTLTRPDISYTVQQICLHMHAPRTPHLALVKRVLRYLHGTLDFGLTLCVSSSTSLMAYSDANLVGCPDSRRSTSGYCVYYGDSLISWSSKRMCRALVLRLSIELWLMLLLSLAGFASYFRNFVALSLRLLLSTATTSPPSTCYPILCNIVAPSILR